MTLPADTPGKQDGDLGGVAVLELGLYQRHYFCARCGGQQLFMEVFECEAGRLGVCLGCGEEKLIAFSRTTEAA